MRVTVSVYGRFHGFNLADQLHRRGALEKLITSYPKSEVRKYGVPGPKVISLLWLEVLRRSIFKLPETLRGGDRLMPLLSASYDRAASRCMPEGADIFVGWSGFSERAALRARANGQMVVIERGSTHIVHQNETPREEYRRLGMPAMQTDPRILAQELREYEIADYICVPSRFGRETFIQRGVAKERLIGTPYGVDLSGFPFGVRCDSTFRLLYVGGMTVRKGLHYLLAAWARLHLPRAELWLVGSRTAETDFLFARYEGLFKYFGHVPQARLHQIYRQCSAFALCSIEDGMGMVALQAMSIGLPVICASSCGAAEVMRDGVDGFIVQARDIGALQTRILQLYNDRDACRQMGEHAHLTVSTGFTWEDYGDRIYAIYQSILQHSHRGLANTSDSPVGHHGA